MESFINSGLSLFIIAFLFKLHGDLVKIKTNCKKCDENKKLDHSD